MDFHFLASELRLDCSFVPEFPREAILFEQRQKNRVWRGENKHNKLQIFFQEELEGLGFCCASGVLSTSPMMWHTKHRLGSRGDVGCPWDGYLKGLIHVNQ